MIVVDASALLAILEGEPDAARYAEALADADTPLISAATLIEAGIVMVNRHGPKAVAKLHALIEQAGIEVESVTPRHARIAIEAFGVYGKGRRHKAGLNYGDCFVYALAKATGLPLLFKGNDFAHMDLSPALWTCLPLSLEACCARTLHAVSRLISTPWPGQASARVPTRHAGCVRHKVPPSNTCEKCGLVVICRGPQ